MKWRLLLGWVLWLCPLWVVAQSQVFVPKGATEPMNVVWVVRSTQPDAASLQRLALQTPGIALPDRAPLVRVFPYTSATGQQWQLVLMSSYPDYAHAKAALKALQDEPKVQETLQDPDCQLLLITPQNFHLAYRHRQVEGYCDYFKQIRQD